MKPASFAYHRADTVEDAVDRLSRLGDDAKLIAGGQSLVAMMNFRLARPTALVDVSRIPGLCYLEREGDVLCIGALTTHYMIEASESPALLDGFAVLKKAARWIGHYPIRTRGTFGGSIAHADPAAEWCLLAVLLDAGIVAVGPRGRRVIPVREFFTGVFSTALEYDEMVVEVRFPAPAPHAALQEFSLRHGDFALVSAAVTLDLDGGTCRSARIALGGVDATPVRIAGAEALLRNTPVGPDAFAEAGQIVRDAIDPMPDIHGSSAYRRDLAAALVQRALAEAAGHGG